MHHNGAQAMNAGYAVYLIGGTAGVHLLYLAISHAGRKWFEPDWQVNLASVPIAGIVATLIGRIGFGEWGTPISVYPLASIFVFGLLFFFSEAFKR